MSVLSTYCHQMFSFLKLRGAIRLYCWHKWYVGMSNCQYGCNVSVFQCMCESEITILHGSSDNVQYLEVVLILYTVYTFQHNKIISQKERSRPTHLHSVLFRFYLDLINAIKNSVYIIFNLSNYLADVNTYITIVEENVTVHQTGTKCQKPEVYRATTWMAKYCSINLALTHHIRYDIQLPFENY